jgi:hypothetical protein
VQVENTLLKMHFCRTPDMLGRVYECGSCQHRHYVYNSCSDRHCPQCMGARRADWIDKTEQLLHSQVTYFQCVFTLPDRLSSLVLGNRRELYALLFDAAWQALNGQIASECGIQPAALMVLHTWNQRLGHHPHVHAIVPGNGPSLDGESWKPVRMTQPRHNKPSRPILVDYKTLGHRFRDAYIAGVRRLIKSGKLKMESPEAIDQLLQDLALIDWAAYIQPPPRDESQPEQIVRYLARYMTGGPISDKRLLKVEDGNVYFLARSKDKSGRQEPAKLSGEEFVRAWSLHILPKGFTKVRSFGAWAYTKRAEYQSLCRQLRPQTDEPPRAEQAQGAEQEPEILCAQCAQRNIKSVMRLVEVQHRPSWAELFYGEGHPEWFEQLHIPRIKPARAKREAVATG